MSKIIKYFRFGATINSICYWKRRVGICIIASRTRGNLCLYLSYTWKMSWKESKVNKLCGYWESSIWIKRKILSCNIHLHGNLHGTCFLHHLITRQLDHSIFGDTSKPEIGHIINITALNFGGNLDCSA